MIPLFKNEQEAVYYGLSHQDTRSIKMLYRKRRRYNGLFRKYTKMEVYDKNKMFIIMLRLHLLRECTDAIKESVEKVFSIEEKIRV